MNIMIYSVAVYGGAGNDFYLKSIFVHIMAWLYLPIIFYSAIPFYKNLWGSLRSRIPSIDIPIGLSIVMGTIMSYYNYFQGNERLYFDSIAMFVFLIFGHTLLVGLFLQERGLFKAF